MERAREAPWGAGGPCPFPSLLLSSSEPLAEKPVGLGPRRRAAGERNSPPERGSHDPEGEGQAGLGLCAQRARRARGPQRTGDVCVVRVRARCWVASTVCC